jgi:PAS domain S-box-containing protein
MNETRRLLLLTAVCLFAVVVFLADVLYPQGGGAAWVLYLPVILAPVSLNKPRQVVLAGAVCSVLVVVGYYLSHPDTLTPRGLYNRGMGVFSLWLTAFAGLIICRRSIQVVQAMSDLQKEVAQHQQTEDALRQSEERFRLAVEGAGIGTWDVNLRTGKTLWSENHFRMLGYEPTPGGEAGRDWWQSRVHPDDVDRVVRCAQEARINHSLHCAEYRYLRADTGETVWLAVFGRWLYDEKGEGVRLVGVSFDITERKRAADSLRESQERFHKLERQLVEIAAQEQQRIGQELHDGVGQELTGLGLMAEALGQRVEDTVTEKQIARRLVAGIERVHQEIRTLSRGLVPVHVELKGLWAALDDLAARAREQSGIPVTFDCPEWVEQPDHAAATHLFRIAQEALSNALRHARPRSVKLALHFEAGGLVLSIRDDGTGMHPPTDESNGMGLRIMQYRAQVIGATLQIGPTEGGGTVVTCTLPNTNGDERNGHDQENGLPALGREAEN